MPITIDGLVSGLDTESIVNGLLEIQQTQLDRIELKRADVLAEQTTFASLEAQLLTFRSSVSALSRSQNNPFEKNLVSVSDESVLTASANTSAVSGTYRLTVDAVARAHQVATQGFADADAEITQGTIDLRIGSGDVTTITIDSSNNTLSELAGAINDADIGINASVIQDASGGATPYKLLLTSSQTGSDNAITLTNNLAATAGNATQPEFDFDTPVQAAVNAQVSLGSGAGAITVESSSNRFDNLIDGVTIDAFNVSDGKEITLNIARDNETARAAVEDFVGAFNDLMTFIDEQSKFDSVTQEGGVLLGNRSVISIQQRLRNAAVSVVPGVDSDINRLSALGITVNDKGQLQLDNGQLSSVLSGSDADITRSDLRRLFALDAQSTSGKIDFVLGSSRTQPSTSPIQVDLTQAAEKASITADSDLAASTVITSSNNTIDLQIDGTDTTVTLNEGTYTTQELADHLESVINSASDLKGRSVNVALSGDTLTITSDSYGSSSVVQIDGGTALTDLRFTAGTTDNGRDVAGTFTVDGETEVATGSGQLLSGDPDNAITADLQLRVQLTPSEIVAGAEAEITITRGIGATLDAVLDDMLDPVNGTLKTIDERFDEELESLQVSLDRQQALFTLQEESLIREFVALESALAELQSTSDFLSSQLAALQPSSSSSRGNN